MKNNNITIKTPILDFIRQYHENGTARFHMPGHKGVDFLGFEHLDITEITGADALYEADGIIAESEGYATTLFNTGKTIYSAEGSSLCIKAMLRLAISEYQNKFDTAEKPRIIAARNVHKSFIYSAALLDFDVDWLYPDNNASILSCNIDLNLLEQMLKASASRYAAVYITSPDYLGGLSDIKTIAAICHKYNTLLLVDNAHGAYLHFLDTPIHPMDLGADICCDSAHKTLPVLTGGAYLHVSKNTSDYIKDNMKQAMALFGSTSPSYLIMASLDNCNKYIADDYDKKLNLLIKKLENIKNKYADILYNSDPLKLTIKGNNAFSGFDIGQLFRSNNCEYEYADEDYLVLMLTPENTDKELEVIDELLKIIDDKQNEMQNPDCTDLKAVKDTISMSAANSYKPAIAMNIKDAVFANHETINVENAMGRICASPLVACPPAIPIVISGEIIDKHGIELFRKYNITKVQVVL